jgi:hypothetical protein
MELWLDGLLGPVSTNYQQISRGTRQLDSSLKHLQNKLGKVFDSDTQVSMDAYR